MLRIGEVLCILQKRPMQNPLGSSFARLTVESPRRDNLDEGRLERLSLSSLDLLSVSYMALVDGVLLRSLYPLPKLALGSPPPPMADMDEGDR